MSRRPRSFVPCHLAASVAALLAIILVAIAPACTAKPEATTPTRASGATSAASSAVAETSAAPEIVGRGSVYRVLPGRELGRPNASGLVVQRFAAAPSRGIVLTFDDGPDPIWTPALLDVLAAERVPAAFFVVGRRASQHPAIIQRAAREGHLIANHSTTHPHLTSLSPTDLDTEVLATQRVIANILGREPTLFRSPFSTSPNITDPSVARALARVTELGLTIVGADAGVEDYTPGIPPETLVEQIFLQLGEPGPWIVVLHDGGGDRTRTIQAVRHLIPEARRRGFEFISLQQFLASSGPAAAGQGMSATLPGRSDQNPNQ
ncbi:MAG: polysaccharide deacetylase family protein [Phycisphaerales bacterium]